MVTSILFARRSSLTIHQSPCPLLLTACLLLPKMVHITSWQVLLVLVLPLLSGVSAGPAQPRSYATTNYCQAGIYKHLLPLSAYAPAQAFCAVKYPIPPKTITATATVTVTAKNPKRTCGPEARSVNSESEVEARDNTGPLLSELQHLNKDVVRSACACIQTTPTVTVSIVSSGSKF